MGLIRRGSLGLVLLAAACHGPLPDVCTANAQCALESGGACEPTGLCAYPDPSCPSGHRYPANAGSYGALCAEIVDASLRSDALHSDGLPDALDNCAAGADCTATFGGLCQASGYCSYPDGSCGSGQRYPSNAGAFSGKCVARPDSGAIDRRPADTLRPRPDASVKPDAGTPADHAHRA